ncbi:hypothetical protein P153DRAFT_295453 [Dothidotthia symphoricarpi CBS 119687]|uniref:RRM domain-containing protein n=1 Tax=Dothidotthia symphoricarpi CBS 119687 TaxID=1392245 RepID=A0A6A6A855_9PLEO|nr:uncharacterized protein P153DRAFT_295453 [Dothidotthia symphoricarpi CBS 119687]KAF2127385.1 hypothetical protein P153DRAFT_295453 [Dothidotthia symphoricarpi CBS 119687]
MLLASRVAIPQRQFTAGARFLEGYVQTPSSEAERARSLALLMLPKRATKSEIEAFLQKAGVDIKRMQLRLDRFTFHNDTICFVELANEKQAQDAANRLNGKILLEKSVTVSTPLKDGFVWKQGWQPDSETSGSRYFLHEDDAAPHEAIKPLLEGRRVMFSVMTPGWGDGITSTRQKASREILHKHLDKYGIEAISGLSPFLGDKRPSPRLLCFIDFETKEGATSAMEALHETEIEGRKVWIKPSEIAPWRAHHFGKVNQSVLATLQEKGLAPQELNEDLFIKQKSQGKTNDTKTRKPKRKPKVQVEKVE